MNVHMVTKTGRLSPKSERTRDLTALANKAPFDGTFVDLTVYTNDTQKGGAVVFNAGPYYVTLSVAELEHLLNGWHAAAERSNWRKPTDFLPAGSRAPNQRDVEEAERLVDAGFGRDGTR